MHIRRKRGWELPESAATPEAVYLNRRDFAKGLAAGPLLLALGAGVFGDARPGRGGGCRSLGQALSLQAQRHLQARPPADAGGSRHQLQQLLRVRLEQGHRRCGPGAADPALDGDHRRHGGEADHDRHRRPPGQDAARGAALPPSLRRGLVDDRALERFRHEGPGGFRQADRERQICPADQLPESRCRRGPAGELVSLALYRGADHERGDRRISPSW